MTPQIPGYLIAFESTVRPLVAAIALGLIWIGAARMEAPAQSRYMTAGALSVALIAWLAIAQYLGTANVYFAGTDNAVPTLLFALLIPLVAAAGNLASLVSAIPLPWIVAAQIYRVAGGIFLVLWADGRLPWQFALPAGIGDVATGSFAVVVAALLARKAAGAHRAVYAWCIFRNRRPRRGGYDGGNDLSGAVASPCSGGAEPPHLVVSARDGTHLRCPTGPDAPRPRSVAAAAADGRDNSAGHGVTPRLINGAGEGD